MPIMRVVRFWLFKKLSYLCWLICPEPDRLVFFAMYDYGLEKLMAEIEEKKKGGV